MKDSTDDKMQKELKLYAYYNLNAIFVNDSYIYIKLVNLRL